MMVEKLTMYLEYIIQCMKKLQMQLDTSLADQLQDCLQDMIFLQNHFMVN